MIGVANIGNSLSPWLTGAIAAAGVVGALGWIKYLAHLIRHRRLAVFLADLALPDRDDPAQPEVVLIFAARDETVGVAAATRSMLDEIGPDPHARLIAVDDRSTDGTGAILDHLASTSSRFEIRHVTDLPAGWLGKTHALQVAASAVDTGTRWLLFTDADVVFAPGAVRRAVAYAEATGVDQVTVSPAVATRSVGERIFVSLFGLLFSMYCPIGRLSDRRSRVHIGVGAFNLVRREAFEAIGGFRHLALSVDDDMRLGQSLKYAGYSMRLLLGAGAVSVRWQEGTWGMIRGIEKNFFAGLKFRLTRAVLVGSGVVVLGIAPFVALGVGPIWTRIVAGVGVVSIATILAGSHRQSRIAWTYVVFMPVAAGLILFALARSVVVTIRRGGINWRDHHYPLIALKTHVRERDTWLDEVWRSTR